MHRKKRKNFAVEQIKIVPKGSAKKVKIWKQAFLYLLVILMALGTVGITASWIGYQPTSTVKELMANNPKTIIEHANYISILGQESTSPTKIMIFYPGASITPRAYVKFLFQLRSQYRHILIAKFALNLAVTNTNAGDQILEEFIRDFALTREYIDNSSITLAGHSLGGAMLSNYYETSEHRKIIRDAIFLGGYPATKILKNNQIPALFLYGENDKILDVAKLEESNKDWSQARTEIIEDMNHSQWADYGTQWGDSASFKTNEIVQARAIAIIQAWAEVRR